MYELKTKVNEKSVIEFLDSVENPQKREDAYRLLDIFTEAAGLQAKMWGESIIGFGSYHYKYASGQEGDAMLTGFSPRKGKFSLYLALWEEEVKELMDGLGKYTAGKSCLYINKLSDIDTQRLQKLIEQSVKIMQKKYQE